MKIRPSLKIRFIVSMILLASAVAIFFSVLTLDSFFQGMDRGQAQTMRAFADVEGVEDGQPLDVMGYHISERWQDIPLEVKEAFDNRPVKDFRVEKSDVGGGWFSPPEKVYFVMKTMNKNGEVRYISKSLVMIDGFDGKQIGRRMQHLFAVAIVAVGVIAVFTSILFLLIKRVAGPVELLRDWAKSLDEDSLKNPVPDFQYAELNTLAEIIKGSLGSVQESVEREHQFLAHASHELRTPISVIRANTELLVKLYEKEQGTKKQFEVVERIDRAGRTMTNLTETLLWLSRDDSNLPVSGRVNLKQMIDELVEELAYLLKNKPVKLEVITTEHSLLVAEIPCRIVLANLIRNAFQHTVDGKVTLTQHENTVSVINSSSFISAESASLGFGLGLSLTKKLANRYGWQYSDSSDETSYKVLIVL
ncbi:sensor histidine kinase [Vibrio algarum]|uniref:histidine kinase n=1 Tax=Vibrio algarum TaxID=3020714 RepID=A0ABT4YUC5_9VIBR|nr:HAMP domain-containing sensor histidine kinase [Vibrio sp. KJ40-1]MDB1125179.1 HAMP domain-containing sensor histidine kinase [Vibrio sp. KJ40-1]